MGNGSIKVGLFSPSQGIAVDDDCFTTASALTAHTGASIVDAPDATARSQDIATWLATAIGTAGATNDVELDVVASVVTVSTGASVAIGMEVLYVLPE